MELTVIMSTSECGFSRSFHFTQDNSSLLFWQH